MNGFNWLTLLLPQMLSLLLLRLGFLSMQICTASRSVCSVCSPYFVADCIISINCKHYSTSILKVWDLCIVSCGWQCRKRRPSCNAEFVLSFIYLLVYLFLCFSSAVVAVTIAVSGYYSCKLFRFVSINQPTNLLHPSFSRFSSIFQILFCTFLVIYFSVSSLVLCISIFFLSYFYCSILRVCLCVWVREYSITMRRELFHYISFPVLPPLPLCHLLSLWMCAYVWASKQAGTKNRLLRIRNTCGQKPLFHLCVFL